MQPTTTPLTPKGVASLLKLLSKGYGDTATMLLYIEELAHMSAPQTFDEARDATWNFGWIASQLHWAYTTGRLSINVASWIKDLSFLKLIDLVTEVVETGNTGDDVARYLNTLHPQISMHKEYTESKLLKRVTFERNKKIKAAAPVSC